MATLQRRAAFLEKETALKLHRRDYARDVAERLALEWAIRICQEWVDHDPFFDIESDITLDLDGRFEDDVGTQELVDLLGYESFYSPTPGHLQRVEIVGVERYEPPDDHLVRFTLKPLANTKTREEASRGKPPGRLRLTGERIERNGR
jgi:hypothetical protein